MTNREEQLQMAAAKWERLTIANDQMFSMVMENNEICLELLQRIFPELAIKQVARTAIQKQVNAPLDARTVRFDVYLQDDQGPISSKCRLPTTKTFPTACGIT